MNPLKSLNPSPLMRQLISRHVGSVGEPSLAEQNLSPPLPKLRPPLLRPKRFVGSHPRTMLQRIL